jgi:hypothetical protein
MQKKPQAAKPCISNSGKHSKPLARSYGFLPVQQPVKDLTSGLGKHWWVKESALEWLEDLGEGLVSYLQTKVFVFPLLFGTDDRVGEGY